MCVCVCITYEYLTWALPLACFFFIPNSSLLLLRHQAAARRPKAEAVVDSLHEIEKGLPNTEGRAIAHGDTLEEFSSLRLTKTM